jgi:hypothetical protein
VGVDLFELLFALGDGVVELPVVLLVGENGPAEENAVEGVEDGREERKGVD